MYVGEFINGSKYQKMTYMEALTTGMAQWPYDYNDEEK